MTQPLSNPPLTLKHGDTFAVFDSAGAMSATPGDGAPLGALGLYHHDTRHLSHLDLRIDGVEPLLLGVMLTPDSTLLTRELTNPECPDSPQGWLGQGSIHVRHNSVLWEGALFERLAVRNHADHARTITITVRFGADFIDLFQVRGTARSRHGTLHPPAVTGPATACLAYTGLDGRQRTTRVRLDPPPTRLEPESATFSLALAPGAGAVLQLAFQCSEECSRTLFAQARHHARRAMRETRARAAAVETSNPGFNAILERSMADLAQLTTQTPVGPYPYAGLPWFNTVFGRDGILTAWFLLGFDPSLAPGVLRMLAATQATTTNPAADAEPGKILHERRLGEMATLGEVPFARYYGSVDATPLFVMLAGATLERTGDIVSARALWPAVEAALAWMDGPGDRDGDGFLEYGRRTDAGLVNQGWKDTHDCVFHADGRLATAPIALAEVQGYAYAARRAGATLARALNEPEHARALDAQAERLRARVEETFWCEDLGTYALALDGAKAPCRVRASNAGHLLFAGLPHPARAARVAADLMTPEAFSGWGVRTLAQGEPHYNPMAYHKGSVWPHDNAVLALGLARYGHKDAVLRVFEGLFAAATHLDSRRLPELFCGFPRRAGRAPTAYLGSCAPQAWAAATPLALLHAALGLGFDPGHATVRLDHPRLPAFLDEVYLSRLPVAGTTVDLTIRRHGDTVTAHRSGGDAGVRLVVVT
ncbi:amylo-alpha-1,6-glucosidase [Pararhodospirillum oryzae]|uniref:Amylo-alpha-1,6-glucosidase n=1 Tax=Pararhodospirillum oryzae TaxID=478448 RepID=A0A512HBW4_9PROT|nr:glycogen debranching N-terminal domain-containing protein [Pararhodospirillum oryzae]GEO82943.1 amylo-alpha-1,6-glucosidase [Pararhodospirillum oryzae]